MRTWVRRTTPSPGPSQSELGTWRIAIANDQVAIMPARAAQGTIGQLFQFDVTDALTKTFCGDCLTPVSVRWVGDELELELDLRHPYALADTMIPPSGTNRRDLWIN